MKLQTPLNPKYMNTQEEWRKLPEHEHYYEVSTEGRVKSLRFDRLLKLYLVVKKGHLVVGIYDGKGNRKTVKVHRLVASAFLPPDPDRPFINHRDGDRKNNKLSNLERVSSQENNSHSHLFLRRGKSSRYIGVSWNKTVKKWQAKVWVNKASKNLGYFKSEEEAHSTYMKALRANGIVNRYAAMRKNK